MSRFKNACHENAIKNACHKVEACHHNKFIFLTIIFLLVWRKTKNLSFECIPSWHNVDFYWRSLKPLGAILPSVIYTRNEFWSHGMCDATFMAAIRHPVHSFYFFFLQFGIFDPIKARANSIPKKIKKSLGFLLG